MCIRDRDMFDHFAYCDRCHETVHGFRYIYLIKSSLEGNYMDLCSDCWSKVTVTDDEAMTEWLINDSRIKDIDNLVFLRIPFSTGDYHDFQALHH
eukprot:TRINITY_DN33156_c0_g1_i1.p2 TRINITY_DN33156_c0_g1~~TRINITY_DN33156_c0_g1_i1.p2  ORF type:complete len:106 (-),score=10.87 TRINITY_DN33156_c0_g1_i1:3-287(-)